MRDTQLHERFKVPISTMGDWKKADSKNWRYIMYWNMQDTLAREVREAREAEEKGNK